MLNSSFPRWAFMVCDGVLMQLDCKYLIRHLCLLHKCIQYPSLGMASSLKRYIPAGSPTPLWRCNCTRFSFVLLIQNKRITLVWVVVVNFRTRKVHYGTGSGSGRRLSKRADIIDSLEQLGVSWGRVWRQLISRW